MVKTEKSLRYLILQYAKKIKRLQQEVADSIARKKKAEVQLRELRWEAKEKTIAKKVTKKKV